jgi:uncharacterized phage-associated protein
LDILKTTQAAAFILKKYNGEATRIRLLKILYIADRELLQQTHRPLTGDRPVAMIHGPVLTHTYDLLKGQAAGIEIWNQYIVQSSIPYVHRLIADPGIGKLSKVELQKLEDLVQRFWFVDDFLLSQSTHAFPEWQKYAPAGNGANPIPIEDVYAAVGLRNNIEELQREALADAELDALLAGNIP